MLWVSASWIVQLIGAIRRNEKALSAASLGSSRTRRAVRYTSQKARTSVAYFRSVRARRPGPSTRKAAHASQL